MKGLGVFVEMEKLQNDAENIIFTRERTDHSYKHKLIWNGASLNFEIPSGGKLTINGKRIITE